VATPDPTIEERLRPGAWDTAGFLLPPETLAARRSADAAACARHGLEPEQVGIRLAELLGAAAPSDVGRPHRHGGHSVTILRQRGMITCPWAADEFEACPIPPGGHPTANRFRILHQSGAALEGFELSAHLIGAHGLFGGVGTRFRIDPDKAVIVLDLA
jgi:hypothetical protein